MPENRHHLVLMPGGATRQTAELVDSIGFDGSTTGYPSPTRSCAPLDERTFGLATMMTAAILEGLDPTEYPEVLVGLNTFGVTAQRSDSRWGLDLATLMLISGAGMSNPWRPQLIVVSPTERRSKMPALTRDEKRPVASRHYLVNGTRNLRESNLRRQLAGKSAVIAMDFVHARSSVRHVIKTMRQFGIKDVRALACWVLRDQYRAVHESFTRAPRGEQEAIPGFCPMIYSFVNLEMLPSGMISDDSPDSSGEISIYREEHA